MHRSLPGCLLLAIIALFVYTPASAAHSPFFSFAKPNDSLRILEILDRYMKIPEGELIPLDKIGDYAVEEFAKRLEEQSGMPVRLPKAEPPQNTGSGQTPRYGVQSVQPVLPDGSLAIAVVTTYVDDVPMFGPMMLDWVFFVRSTADGWRISSLRRQNAVDKAVTQLRALDTATQYPRSLKPIIAREVAPFLMSNEQLRDHFNSHRASFNTLAHEFHRGDSMIVIARTDKVITQLNNVTIDWGIAAQEVPKEAMDEFLAIANPEQQKYMQKQMQMAEQMRKDGKEKLGQLAKRFHITQSRLDTTVQLMQDLHVNYVNTRLPWEKSVQFTVGGFMDDAIGYIYTPAGQGPFISNTEYFYLEDLGGGWWIFRST